MWHQHVCLFGCLIALLIIIQTLHLNQTQLPSWTDTEYPNLQLPVEGRLTQLFKRKVLLQFLGSGLCLIYWSVTYTMATFPKLTMKSNWNSATTSTAILWRFIVKPYLIGCFFHSIYFLLLILHETGTLKPELEIQWRNVLDRIRHNSTNSHEVRLHMNRLERIQRIFRCCGAHSLADWDGVDPQGIGLNHLWTASKHMFRPWKQVVNYVPPSCCDSERTALCTADILQTHQLHMVDQESRAYNEHIPVFRRGCVHVVSEELETKLEEIFLMTLLPNVFLHAVQLCCCFFAYNVRKPEKVTNFTGNNINQSADDDNFSEVSEESEVSWRTNEPYPEEQLATDRQESDKWSKPRQTKRRLSQPAHSNGLFNGPWGYVSNKRLLAACQNFAIYGQLSQVQSAFWKIRARWLERGIRIGWSLTDRRKHYATFLRRINWRNKYRPCQLEWSSLRRWLRCRLPLIEAALYADGNVIREIEGNAVYRGLTAHLIRIICSLCLGYVVSYGLIRAFVPKLEQPESGTSTPVDIEEKLQRNAYEAAREVASITALFIRIVVMFGSVVSRRVRCMLLLLVPSLGLTVGRSYLGAELVHTILIGPAATTERNLRASAKTLQCLMELAENITRDAKQFYEESKEAVQLDNSKDFYETIKGRSLQFVETIEQYRKSVDKLMKEVSKLRLTIWSLR
ncbi:unnamed protein product [Dicrocoelium dendriticum]|nr:unnamed protein product [Dicrocoelium dendriticum]